jgi:ABC-type transport system involved in cytochrome c biogenesis permease subunit
MPLPSYKELLKVTGIPVVIASLCCLAPVILVLAGLSTVTFAASFSDVLYGQYMWLFRGVGLVLLVMSAYFYITRTKGICTVDEVKKRRNEIINIIAVILITGVVGYIFFML